MNKYLLGRKIGMTELIMEDGNIVPVTVVAAGPCTVLEVCTKDQQGFDGVLLGYENAKESKVNRPKKAQFEKYGVSPKKIVKSARIANSTEYESKQEITLSIFEKDEKVSVRSKTIGRGFAGTIKRHGFSRGLMTHGSKTHRIPGSIGAGTYPGRVFKGTRMAGQHGNENVTIKNLTLVEVDADKGYLYIKGSIPGKKNNLVEIFN